MAVQSLSAIFHPTQSRMKVLAEDLNASYTTYVQQYWREYLQECTSATSVSIFPCNCIISGAHDLRHSLADLTSQVCGGYYCA